MPCRRHQNTDREAEDQAADHQIGADAGDRDRKRFPSHGQDREKDQPRQEALQEGETDRRPVRLRRQSVDRKYGAVDGGGEDQERGVRKLELGHFRRRRLAHSNLPPRNSDSRPTGWSRV